MRGILHIQDLRSGSRGQLAEALTAIGHSLGPVVAHCPYPPPELGVLGADDEDWRRLAGWLGESERLERLDSLLDWIVPGESWQPEKVPPPGARQAWPAGEWWGLNSLEVSKVACGLQGRHLFWNGQRYDLSSGAESRLLRQEKRYFGYFPERNLAMDGWRCRYNWMWLTPEGPCDLAANAHDWPVGHAKKLYGYRDNEPLRGEVSWDGQICLSVYEVDAVLSTAPFPWHEVAPGVVALSWPPVDSVHSVFYVLNPHYDLEEEEDVRDGPPVLVLGPSAELRYALALDRPVARRRAGDLHRLDSNFEEYAVFDYAHSRVRTGSGRLLGGNAERLVIWDKGQLLAEDFRGGARSLFGYEGNEIEWALPVNGGWNLVLLRENYLRLI